MILIVDDNLNLLEAVQFYLKKQGFDCLVASRVKECTAIFSVFKKEIKLVLLDSYLLNGSGEEVLEFIRKENKKIPVICVTGRPDISKTYTQEGYTDYLEKFFTMGELLKKINKYLK